MRYGVFQRGVAAAVPVLPESGANEAFGVRALQYAAGEGRHAAQCQTVSTAPGFPAASNRMRFARCIEPARRDEAVFVRDGGRSPSGAVKALTTEDQTGRVS
jgi:hypothetical protein